jgi:hypothetical protein
MVRTPVLKAADVLETVEFDRGLLQSVIPRVQPSAVPIRIGPVWFRAVWGRRIAAIALPWGVYVRPDVMDRFQTGREPRRNARLVVHELTHVEQWRRFGGPRLVLRYSTDYIAGLLRTRSHWEAYRGVRTEVEARAAARLVVGSN